MMHIQVLGRILILKFYKLISNVGGINSRTGDGQHVGFIDLDSMIETRLESVVRFAQLKFNLGNAYVLRSSNRVGIRHQVGNYHIVFLDKHSLGFWIDVMKFIGDDKTKKYQLFTLKRGRMVLRITSKGDKKSPEFHSMIRSNAKGGEKSFAHFKWLKLQYGKDIVRPVNRDNLTHVGIEEYSTVESGEEVGH